MKTISTSYLLLVEASAATMADLPVRSRSSTGILSTNAFDTLGRVVSAADSRGNAFSFEYDAAGNVAAATDAADARSEYGYDTVGRLVASTNALGLVRRTAYDADGNAVAEWGDVQRAEYEFDEYGRRISFATFRGEGDDDDVTRWLLDEETDFAINKVFADGSSISYDYTPDRLLASLTWARGVGTSYAYDGFGNTLFVEIEPVPRAVKADVPSVHGLIDIVKSSGETEKNVDLAVGADTLSTPEGVTLAISKEDDSSQLYLEVGGEATRLGTFSVTADGKELIAGMKGRFGDTQFFDFPFDGATPAKVSLKGKFSSGTTRQLVSF